MESKISQSRMSLLANLESTMMKVHLVTVWILSTLFAASPTRAEGGDSAAVVCAGRV